LIQPATSDTRFGLITLKNNGGLVVPSVSVVSIVKHCERFLRSRINVKSVQKYQWESIECLNIIRTMDVSVFPELETHFIETAREVDTHYYVLMKLIVSEFLRLRRFHAIGLSNVSLQGKSVRQKLTKDILFLNQ
jgi:hypothetical protein